MAGLIIDQIAVGPMANFSYLIGKEGSGELIVIDLGWEADRLLNRAAKRGCTISAILLTHGHFDHVQAVPDLLKELSVPVYIHPKEMYSMDSSVSITPLREGSEIHVAGVRVECLSTPGHSPEGLSFVIDGNVFTGDTLFVGGCGRADLPGSDPVKLYHSLQRLATLPDEMVVYCGHDYGSMPTSTIGHEKRHNPHMRATSLESFLKFRT